MGKKGGSENTTTTVKLPKEIEDAAKQNLKVADQVAALGAMPYTGPSVAGFAPQQLAGMQGANQAAQAFGMASAPTQQGMSSEQMYQALTGMQGPNSQMGGFSGYSAAPMFEQAYQGLPPAQRALIESFLFNPVTGAAPTNPTLSTPAVQVNPAAGRTAAERTAIQNANVQRQQAAAAAAPPPRQGLIPFNKMTPSQRIGLLASGRKDGK